MLETKYSDSLAHTAFQLLAWVVISTFLPQNVLAALPVDFQKTQIIGTGLDGPSGFEIAPDGRIFILERTGKVKIYKNGTLLATPFVNLYALATGDRGLIGIAFDPDYDANHWVYFYYTGTDSLNHLVRFDASDDIASNNGTEIYRTTFPSNELHVGGTIQFGNDGKLYLSIGDNGNAPNAQSLDNPFGKILRLNKDGSIPSDNPFVGQPGKLPELWAYGLRNPFRFQIDSETGRLYEGDVGNNTWEEINLIQKGKNYGWPTCEGPQNTGVGTCNNSSFTYPVYAYAHSGLSSAVAGGPIYNASLFPNEYRGNLFFGDYARGFIRRIALDSNGNSTGAFDFDTSAGSVVDLKVASDGSLYYVTYIPGRLYRISYSASNQTPLANSSADTNKGTAPLAVHFSSAGSYDPDGTPLVYAWDFGDGSSSNSANPTKTYQNKGTYTVELTVSDGVNSSQATPIVIQVGVPPIVYINTPGNGSLYKAGDTIFWSGSGTDGAGFDLPDNAFSTEVIFHHDTHIHPFLGPIQEKSGQFTIPVIGEASPNTWFEIKLTGTDSNGLSTTESTYIYPKKVNITFNSVPAGLQILLDGGPITTPQTVQHVVGFQRQISTPSSQAFNGKAYSLTSWSDGGALTHTISAPTNDTTITANFYETQAFNAQYFNNKTLTGSPVLTRADQIIDFDWGGGSPDTLVNVDNFSARWIATQSFAAGTYIFSASADDGVRLWIDNQLLIDTWIDQGETTYDASIPLTSGAHTIKMEYYENGGGAVARLSWSSNSTTPPPPPPVPPSNPGDGLSGEYFNNKDLTASILQRIDSAIDFDWGYDSPSPLIDSETFSARWTGQITPQFSEPYTFYTSSDDGVRLWVGGQLLIDKWIDQGTSEWSGTINLTAGQKYDIKLEYYENSVTADVKLYWSSPSTPKQIIPQTNLFSTTTVSPPPPPPPTPQPTSPVTIAASSLTPTAPYTVEAKAPSIPDIERVEFWDNGVLYHTEYFLPYSIFADINNIPTQGMLGAGSHLITAKVFSASQGQLPDASLTLVEGSIGIPPPPPPPPAGGSGAGLKGEYFDNIDLTNLKITRTDPSINFAWGGGSPDPALDVDTFSVRWTGQVAPQYSETYTFYTYSDDGVRLWVNNQRLIDKWIDQPDTLWSTTIPLIAGQTYDIKMEYFENGGGSNARLSWSAPSQPKQVIPQNRLIPAP